MDQKGAKNAVYVVLKSSSVPPKKAKNAVLSNSQKMEVKNWV